VTAGIPAGWEGREREDLREGAWRFVRVRDREGRASVREDNLPLRDGEPMPGPAGLSAFLADLDAPADADPARLAAQVGCFLIRGSSRESCAVRVVVDRAGLLSRYPHDVELASPRLEARDGGLELSAWFERDGYVQRLVLRWAPGADPSTQWSEPVPRA
jgi:hypothetical protein